MGNLITRVNFSKKEAGFFDRIKESTKRFVAELNEGIKAMSVPKEPLDEDDEILDEDGNQIPMATLMEGASRFRELAKKCGATSPQEIAAKEITKDSQGVADSELDMSLVDVANGKDYLDDFDDYEAFEAVERQRERWREQERMSNLFRACEAYRQLILTQEKALAQGNDNVAESESGKSEQELKLAQIVETLSEMLYAYGCNYGVSVINERDFELVSGAFADSLSDRADAMLVREFMQCKNLPASMRVTLLYKIIEGKSSLHDLWVMASLVGKDTRKKKTQQTQVQTQTPVQAQA